MRTIGPCLPSLFTSTILSFFLFSLARADLPDYPMTLGDMEVLAGYYTSDGKYLGGIPEPHDPSWEIYQCTEFLYAEPNNTASDATVCAAWSVDESYGEGFQLGTCECMYYAANEAYCSDWLCEQDGNENTFCQCDDDVSDSQDSLYCNSWSCKQISPGGRFELEEYNCQRSSPSGDYCEAWNGNVTASDEVEVVACECMANWNGDQVCSFWICEELGLSTCNSAGHSWCDLGVSVGVGGGLGLIGVVMICGGILGLSSKIHPTELNISLIAMGVLWCLSWSSAVVVWGGADGATYVGVMWVLSVAVFMCCAYFYRRCKDEQGPQPAPPQQQRSATGGWWAGKAVQRGRA